MQSLKDFFPLAVFGLGYLITRDLITATLLLIAATGVQLGIDFIRHGRVERLHLIMFLVLLGFGGFTLLFSDPIFIQWKPSIVNLVFALVFLGSHFIGRKPLFQRLIETVLQKTPHLTINMPERSWRLLNLSWVVFFLAVSGLNLYVATHFDEDTWVTFRLLGLSGLNLVFFIAQFVYLQRFMVEVEHKPSSET